MDAHHLTKIAVIADIHGNVDALRAVLEDIQRQTIGSILNLGDHLSGPLAARETLALIRKTPMQCLRGNHDRWLVEQSPAQMGPSDRAAHGELGPDDLAWLRALPPVLTVEGGILACHGTPESDLTYWMQDVRPDGAVVERSQGSVEGFARRSDARVMLCGHTHLAGARRLSDGRQVINPGSVGLQAYDDLEPVPHVMEAGSPEARYAVLSASGAGWQVMWRKVAYDPSRMIALAEARGRPDWAHALATGRMPGKGGA